MNLLQRTLATLSATSTAALMTLPVVAQSAPMNNGMNNGTTSNSSTAVNCAYITGGVGGPVDTQASGNQTAPSSYDTASSGIQGNTSVPLGNQNTSGAITSGNQTTGSQISGNQTSGNQTTGSQISGSQTSGNQASEGTSGSQISGNQATGNQTAPSSYDTASSGVQGNTSVPLGNQNTSGSTSSGNQISGNQASGSQTSGNQISGNQATGNQTAPSSYDTASSGVQGNTSVPLGNQNTSGSTSNANQSNMGQRMSATTYHAMMQVTGSPDHRQFDANNYHSAVAFRRNGIAATSGHEAKLNLNAYQQGRNALAANNLSTSAVLPVACAPR